MTVTNDILPFCSTDTGTNLLSQAAYAADAQLPIGNQPGIARSQLNNKALRQGTFIASQIAQFVANKSGQAVNDDANTNKLLALIQATLTPLSMTSDNYFGVYGSPVNTNYYLKYVFFATSVNATVGATYTHNSGTFTVIATVAASNQVMMSGTVAPTASGALTLATGTGDSTITFFAFRAPIYLKVTCVGGGGGGAGANTSGATNGSTGGNSVFSSASTALVQAFGGGGGGAGTSGGGGAGGNGGGCNYASPATLLIVITGGSGTGGTGSDGVGGCGGPSFFGGAGGGGQQHGSTPGYPGSDGSGSGGGGGGSAASFSCGGGGASAGYIQALIPSPLNAYYIVSTGDGGAGGVNGILGGHGGTGHITVEAYYQ